MGNELGDSQGREGGSEEMVEEVEEEAAERLGVGLNLPTQLDRNHSLRQYPAETFDMEIHDCVTIWT